MEYSIAAPKRGHYFISEAIFLKPGKFWICFLLLFALCLSLCACSFAPQSGSAPGGTSPSGQKQSSEPVGMGQEARRNVVQRLASTEVKPPEGSNINWIGSLAELDGRLYFKAESLESCRLFSVDLNGGDRQELTAYNGARVQGFGASDHGTLYVLSAPYNETSRRFEYSLQEVDKTGEALRQEPLAGVIREDFMPFWVAAGGDRLFLLGGGSLVTLRAGERLEKEWDLPVDAAAQMAVLADGRLLLGQRDGGRYELCLFDADSGSLSAVSHFDKGSLSLLCGGERWDVYLSDGTSAYGFDLSSGKLEKQFEWLSVGIVGRALLEAPEGGFFAADGNSRLFRMRPVEVEVGEDGEPATMTLVVLDRLFLSPVLEDAILDWNRAHPECMIVVRDYYTGEHGNDWQKELQAQEAARQAMALDIITGGTHPDLFDLSDLNAAALAVGGKLENLYPYLDADPELSRESFYPNVLRAQELRGGLYEVVTNYSLLTATGFASEVGAARSWDELFALAESTSRCQRLFSAEARGRTELLELLTNASGKKLVDWDSGACHFDTPYFLSLLEAAAQLPAQGADPGEYYADQPSPADGDGLLSVNELPQLWLGAAWSRDYGEENCAVVGLPELGSVLLPSGELGTSTLGMASDSAHKAECWAFLRTFYLNPRSYAFSPMQGGLEVSIQEELRQREQEGLADKRPNAEADLRLFAEAFAGADMLYRHDDAVWEIVRSEAERYFAGECSAEDCAGLIQRRAQIYLSEQCG